jgi:hypothetical protein
MFRLTTPVPLDTSSGLFLRGIRAHNGFPKENALFHTEFMDGVGTNIDNVLGGTDGLLESLISSNNGSAWKGGVGAAAGGLQIQGGSCVSMPAIDPRLPWDIFLASVILASVGDTTSSKNYMSIGFRTTLAGNFRGAMMYTSGDVQWNPPTNPLNALIRVSNGAGSVSAPVNLSPINQTNAVGSGRGRIRRLTYDGTGIVYGRHYDKDGNLLEIGQIATSDTNMVIGSGGVELDAIQPIFGPYPSATYCQGKADLEAGTVYTGRNLSDAEVKLYAVAAAAKAAARGRPWT